MKAKTTAEAYDALPIAGGNGQRTTPTVRQLAVLRAIAESIDGRGYPPTLREIRDVFGWAAHGAANDVLRALVRYGMIVRDAGTARGLRLTDAGRAAL